MDFVIYRGFKRYFIDPRYFVERIQSMLMGLQMASLEQYAALYTQVWPPTLTFYVSSFTSK